MMTSGSCAGTETCSSATQKLVGRVTQRSVSASMTGLRVVFGGLGVCGLHEAAREGRDVPSCLNNPLMGSKTLQVLTWSWRPVASSAGFLFRSVVEFPTGTTRSPAYVRKC